MERYRSYHIDSVICFNVLEHIEQDEKALKNIFDLLEPGGRLLLLVPSHPWLYGTLDQHLGHYRRYGKKELKNKLETLGFKVIFLKYFNRIGIWEWFLNSKILRKKKASFLSIKNLQSPRPPIQIRKILAPSLRHLPACRCREISRNQNDGDD